MDPIDQVELNKNETLNVKELKGKHKNKKGKHNMKTPKPLLKKTQRLAGADAWLPFSPGRC